MIYKATTSLRARLLNLPETGMGYQVIRGPVIGQMRDRTFVVYNAMLLVTLKNQEYFESDKERIVEEGFKKIKKDAPSIAIGKIKILDKTLDNEIIVKEPPSPIGAKDNPEEEADGKKVYVRLSAYTKDYRVDKKAKRLNKGSFVTTLEDYESAKKDDIDFRDHYALPNNKDLEVAFHFQPEKGTKMRKGKVQSAFGRDGGGVEILFSEGTQKNTLKNEEKL